MYERLGCTRVEKIACYMRKKALFVRVCMNEAVEADICFQCVNRKKKFLICMYPQIQMVAASTFEMHT